MTRSSQTRLTKAAAGNRISPNQAIATAQAGLKSELHRAARPAGAASASRREVHIRLCVGVDVVTVSEVAAALDRFRDRYVSRLFTAREAAYCQAGSGATRAARFAARFAAKEAAVKALQPTHPWADWRAIEVRRDRAGRCDLILSGEAASLARRRRIHSLALSMSHDGDHAAAIVVALRHVRHRGGSPER
jgi:holo-[acyl-carrier protein] synthase